MSDTNTETNGQLVFQELIEHTAINREFLLNQNEPRLSLPSEVGKLVIVVSGAPGSAKKGYDPSEHGSFIHEAERLGEERASKHGGFEIKHRADFEELSAFFRDPEVSDITLIGHGSISRLWLDSGAKDFGWLNAAKSTTHLKRGTIEQRMCGHFGCNYTVPLGTFAVSKFSEVKAAIGLIIPDGVEPDDSIFQPIFDDVTPINDQIKSLNDTYRGMIKNEAGTLITSKEYYGEHLDTK